MYIIYVIIILLYMHILVKVEIKVISFNSRLLAQLTIMHNYLKQFNIDVVPLMKTAGVVENSGHCIYSIGLKCF